MSIPAVDCSVLALQLKKSVCNNSHACTSKLCDTTGSRDFPWILLGMKGLLGS